MGGKVGQAECHECYIKFPKKEMKQIEVQSDDSKYSLRLLACSFSKNIFQDRRTKAGKQVAMAKAIPQLIFASLGYYALCYIVLYI